MNFGYLNKSRYIPEVSMRYCEGGNTSSSTVRHCVELLEFHTVQTLADDLSHESNILYSANTTYPFYIC